jgi:spermidine/putrescine transport system permease protein
VPDWLRRHRGLVPYLFLVPGGLWLIVFFVLPLVTVASVALQEGTLGTGFRLTFNFGVFPEAISRWETQLLRSLQFGLIVTVLAMLIGYPMAYTIAFRGGRYKNILLLFVIMPFFTSFIIRTISWKFILADQGFFLGTLKDLGIVELYASRLQAFLRVTLPLSISGVFAASLLSFIPAVGDYLNAELLGSRNETMIGNVIQRLYLVNNDYPQASALSLLLMLGILVSVFLYRRVLRGQELTV